MYTNLRNLVEGEIYRNIHIYANEFSEFTHTTTLVGEKQEARDERAVVKAALWYSQHVKVEQRWVR